MQFIKRKSGYANYAIELKMHEIAICISQAFLHYL